MSVLTTCLAYRNHPEAELFSEYGGGVQRGVQGWVVKRAQLVQNEGISLVYLSLCLKLSCTLYR